MNILKVSALAAMLLASGYAHAQIGSFSFANVGTGSGTTTTTILGNSTTTSVENGIAAISVNMAFYPGVGENSYASESIFAASGSPSVLLQISANNLPGMSARDVVSLSGSKYLGSGFISHWIDDWVQSMTFSYSLQGNGLYTIIGSGFSSRPLPSLGEATYASDWELRDTQIFFSNVSLVPEPASWALMIGGFGLAGGALRSRSAKVRLAA